MVVIVKQKYQYSLDDLSTDESASIMFHNGYRTIFNIECDTAKDISQHSFYPYEDEILMYPARQLQVISSCDSGNQLNIIHVKEMRPLLPLIHIP